MLNPLSDSASTVIADWLELVVLSSQRRRLSPGKAHDILTGSGSAVDEVDVALAFGTLNERCRRGLLGYPFRFTRLGLERAEIDPTLYGFTVLIAAASHGSVSLPDAPVAARLFELLVRSATASLFGPNAGSVRFGHPPEPDRPVAFQDAVTWLARKLRTTALPLRGAALRRTDGGIDVVAWRDFGDGRSCAPVAAVQATVEGDLRGKSLEIAANELDRWIAIAKPVPVLASPFDGSSDPDLFDELSSRVLVLDRWRLVSTLGDTAEPEVSAWASARLSELAVYA